MAKVRARPEPPAIDVHAELTWDGHTKIPCVCCDGEGFQIEVYEHRDGGALAMLCGCTAGLRLRCALPESLNPVPVHTALRTAIRLGLPARWAGVIVPQSRFTRG